MASVAPGTAEDPTADNPAHAGSGTLDSDGFEKCLAAEALPEGSRKLVRLSTGRGVLLLRHGGQVFAMDHACYHHGAPLATGDIEDLGGSTCLVCPWHKYKLNLETGEGMYIGIDPFNKGADGKPCRIVKSKGLKQRVHRTRTVDGHIWVLDASTEKGSATKEAAPATTKGSLAEAQFEVASDQYAHESFARSRQATGLHSHRSDGEGKR